MYIRPIIQKQRPCTPAFGLLGGYFIDFGYLICNLILLVRELLLSLCCLEIAQLLLMRFPATQIMLPLSSVTTSWRFSQKHSFCSRS